MLTAVAMLSWCCPHVFGQAAPKQAPAVYLEDSPTALELFDKAQRLSEQSRFIEAAITYQQIIESFGQKLVAQPDGLHSDARGHAIGLIRADRRLLRAYRDTYRTVADQMLIDAIADKDGPAGVVAVLDRYWLCKAGLEGALYQAARYLDVGRPAQAIALLDEVADHPALDQQRPRWHRLQAAAGLFADRPSRYEQHLGALTTAGEAQAVDEIRRWERHLRRPIPPQVTSAGQISPAVSIPASLGASLWGAALDTSPAHMATSVSIRRVSRRRRGTRPIPFGFPALPSVSGGRLYLNDTGTVYALDLSSGREVWSYTSRALESPSHVQRITQRLRLMGSELRGVWIGPDTVISVLGYAVLGRGNNTPDRPGGTTVVCLERDTGVPVWELEPADVDPSLSTGSFVGSPVGWSGHAYVVLSRSQTSGFQASYLVAVDVSDGGVAWWRHLWSRPVDRTFNSDTTRVTVVGPDLYPANNAGAVARLRARDGAVVWLNKLPQPPVQVDPRKRRRAERPPLPSAPVVAEAGVLVLTNDSKSPVTVLDRDSGRVTRELQRDSLKDVAYLTATPSGTLAVGPTVELIDPATLQPRWTRELESELAPHRQCRAAITEDRVLLPGNKHLAVLDLSNGKTVSVSPLDKTGNLLALPDQVIVAGSGQVRSYQAWELAYKHLSAQVADSPLDPMPALALAHIALAADRRQVALDAVDHAIDALADRAAQQGPADGVHETIAQLQRRVFGQVLSFIDEAPQIDPEVRLKLFERLATLATHPGDRVAYHLAMGDDLVEAGRYPQAVSQYQRILEDRPLAIQVFDRGDGPLSAEFEARRRLSQLVKQYGPNVYKQYETLAAQRLVELTARAPVDPSSLMRLAREYPLSRSSRIATVAAAEAYAQRGDYRAAAAQLHRVYHKTDEAGLLQRVVGRLAVVYEQQGQPDRAARVLRRAKKDHPDLRPLRDGRPASTDAWLAELASTPQPDSAAPAAVGLLGTHAVAIDEHLLVPSQQPRDSWSHETIITVDGSILRLRTGRDLTERWKFALPNPRVQLIGASEEQVLIRCGIPGVLIALDARTGRPLWPALSVQDLLDIPGPVWATGAPSLQQPAGPVRARVNIEPLAPAGAHARIRANESIVCVADASGLLVAVDRRTGETLWRLVSPIGIPRSVHINEHVVVVAAGRSQDQLRTGGASIVLDAMTGEPLHPAIAGRQELQWVGVGEDTVLVHSTSKKIVAYDLYSGKVIWWQPERGTPVPGPDAAVVSDDLIIVRLRDRPGPIYLFDATDGRVINRLVMPASNRWNALDAQRISGDWYLLTERQAVAVSSDGSVAWLDAVHLGNNEKFILQVLGRDHVYLFTDDTARGARANPKGRSPAPYKYQIYTLDRRSGTIVDESEIKLASPIQPGQTVAVDGALIVGTSAQTVVLKGHTNPSDGP